MRTEAKVSFILKFMLSISLFGLLTTILMVAYSPSVTADFVLRRPIIGSIFVLICVAGAMAALSPRKCSKSFTTYIRETAMRPRSGTLSSVSSRGHHPDCGNFSGHVIRLGQMWCCAACTGLAIGAAVAVVIAVPYFFFGFDVGEFSSLLVIIGLLGPGLGFIQFRLKGWTRTAANAFFVVASSLTIIGMDQRARSVFLDLYVITLLMFWILTRITISQWDHTRTCLICDHRCR